MINISYKFIDVFSTNISDPIIPGTNCHKSYWEIIYDMYKDSDILLIRRSVLRQVEQKRVMSLSTKNILEL